MASPTEPKQQAELLWQKFGLIRPETDNPGFWTHLSNEAEEWARTASVGKFWESAKAKKESWRHEFKEAAGGTLYADEREWESFKAKRERAIVDKVKREFCKSEADMRGAFAESGPPIPSLDDLVRTRIVCRYVDGVEFLASKLQSLAHEHDLHPIHKRQGNERGYFAQHIYFDHHVIFKYGGYVSSGCVRCEIQIATQLATTMWHESHGSYEQTRSAQEGDENWQWNPKDPRFITYQLGHTLHLADGLLVLIRDNSAKGSTT
jgi:hypothetical protein